MNLGCVLTSPSRYIATTPFDSGDSILYSLSVSSGELLAFFVTWNLVSDSFFWKNSVLSSSTGTLFSSPCSQTNGVVVAENKRGLKAKLIEKTLAGRKKPS